MALAGHPVAVFAKATNATAVSSDEVDGINSVTYSPKVNMLDASTFKDTTGFALKLACLKDGSVSLAGDYTPSDAPQMLIMTSWTNGVPVWITMHFNPTGAAGTKGFQVQCKVESFEIKGDVASKVEFSASLNFDGAPVAV